MLLIILDNFENAEKFRGKRRHPYPPKSKAITIPIWLALFLLIFFFLCIYILYTFYKIKSFIFCFLYSVLYSAFLFNYYIVSSLARTVV